MNTRAGVTVSRRRWWFAFGFASLLTAAYMTLCVDTCLVVADLEPRILSDDRNERLEAFREASRRCLRATTQEIDGIIMAGAADLDEGVRAAVAAGIPKWKPCSADSIATLVRLCDDDANDVVYAASNSLLEYAWSSEAGRAALAVNIGKLHVYALVALSRWMAQDAGRAKRLWGPLLTDMIAPLTGVLSSAGEPRSDDRGVRETVWMEARVGLLFALASVSGHESDTCAMMADLTSCDSAACLLLDRIRPADLGVDGISHVRNVAGRGNGAAFGIAIQILRQAGVRR